MKVYQLIRNPHEPPLPFVIQRMYRFESTFGFALFFGGPCQWLTLDKYFFILSTSRYQ